MWWSAISERAVGDNKARPQIASCHVERSLCHSERNEAQRNEVEESLAVICFPPQNSKRCLPPSFNHGAAGDSARHDKRIARARIRWVRDALFYKCAGIADAHSLTHRDGVTNSNR